MINHCLGHPLPRWVLFCFFYFEHRRGFQNLHSYEGPPTLEFSSIVMAHHFCNCPIIDPHVEPILGLIILQQPKNGFRHRYVILAYDMWTLRSCKRWWRKTSTWQALVEIEWVKKIAGFQSSAQLSNSEVYYRYQLITNNVVTFIAFRKNCMTWSWNLKKISGSHLFSPTVARYAAKCNECLIRILGFGAPEPHCFQANKSLANKIISWSKK